MDYEQIALRLGELGFTNEREMNEVFELLRDFSVEEQAIILDTMPSYGDFIDFNGQNCDDVRDDDDPCKGWDGYSRRCSCGNRRVSWIVESTYAYGEAH